MSKENNSQKVLFEDKDVKITDQFVYIKWYFFPWGGTKKIALKDIKKVEKRELGWAKYRLWGMDASQWGYWLPGDKNRMSRTYFIGITVESSTKPSFTTEHVDQVYDILKDLVRNHRQSEQRIANPSSQNDEEKRELKQISAL